MPVLELPPGTVPAFYLFVLVLCLDLEENLLKLWGLGRIMHILHWPAVVCASFVVLLVTSTAALPIEQAPYDAPRPGGPAKIEGQDREQLFEQLQQPPTELGYDQQA